MKTMKRTGESTISYLVVLLIFLSQKAVETRGKHLDKCLKCKCLGVPPSCPKGVPIVMDGCGCCPICARQQGDSCDQIHLCDPTRQLDCAYHNTTRQSGICKAKKGLGCFAGGRTYEDGETFKLDCRSQCTCQNGTYGCVSLCPHENIRPSGSCRNPQLLLLHNTCCREWLCETSLWKARKLNCKKHISDWTPCSVSCGIGLSTRMTNDNPECELKMERRLCQIRSCELVKEFNSSITMHHRRRRHLCRATIKTSSPVHITDNRNCSSVKYFEPKYCGYCGNKHCCHPKYSTTIKMTFLCNSTVEDTSEAQEVFTKNYMWIVKCDCDEHC